jgi:hypothetical protein
MDTADYGNSRHRRNVASGDLADFLYGPPDASGADSYVLCEINASSCFAIPDEAPAAIAGTVAERLSGAKYAL